MKASHDGISTEKHNLRDLRILALCQAAEMMFFAKGEMMYSFERKVSKFCIASLIDSMSTKIFVKKAIILNVFD